MKRFVLAFVFVIGAFGRDSLTLTDAAGPAGATVNLLLTLNTTSATVAGLQWDVSVPAGVLYGTSSLLPGKTLTCNGGRCLLVGDSKVIRSGPVGVLAVTLPSGKSAPITVALSKVAGVLADGTARPTSGSTATITPGGSTCPPCNCAAATSAKVQAASLFGGSQPERIDGGADKPVELGVKFTSEVAGTVTGIRFYKSPENTGTHMGTLWSRDGNRLATVAFSNETATGWQTAMFAHPVKIQANVTYVASYLCTRGHYSADAGFFARPLDNSPLRGLAGVFAYGTTPTFPNTEFNASNYWVDLIFRPE